MNALDAIALRETIVVRSRSTWSDGRCGRNHDITIPDNVALRKRADRVERICRLCEMERKAARSEGRSLPPAVTYEYAPRVCEGCGTEYHRPRRMARAEWERRRYCSRKCSEDNRANDMSPAAPLPPDEVVRLRRLVGLPDVLPEGDIFAEDAA